MLNKFLYLTALVAIFTSEMKDFTPVGFPADIDKYEVYEFGEAKIYPGKCGICKKDGIEVAWLSPSSMGAHQTCFDQIKIAESETMDYLKKTCPNPATVQLMHSRLIYFLEKAIIDVRGYKSIKDYHDTMGDWHLTMQYFFALENK